MAKNKKWNKVIARIQALEDALAGLLTGKSASGAKRKKAKKKKKAPAKKTARSKRKASAKKPAPKPVKARAQKSVTPARKPRKKSQRVTVAESAPILPPVPSL